jgi:hypothetical protein
MGNERSSLFDSEDDPLDISAFQPKQRARQSAAVTQMAAEKSGFKSREPKAAAVSVVPKSAQQRRHRTGRNAQFNVKAKPETIAEFAAIADAQGWVFGEAFEKAVVLMAREYGKKKAS